jgi:hypothetical protein
MPLVCSVAMEQLQRDPTLDYHWDLWKKTHEKEYKDKVDDCHPSSVLLLSALFSPSPDDI